MAPVVATPSLHAFVKRASLGPLTPASLALIIVGCVLTLTVTAVAVLYHHKRRARQSGPQPAPKPDDRSSSTASEEHQMQPMAATREGPVAANNVDRNDDDANNYRYSVGIMSRVSYGGPARSPRMPRSPAANNRYSVGMLSRTSVDPSVSSPNPNRDRSRSRSRADRDRAYSRMSVGIMSRVSMGGARSPAGPRSPMSPRDPLMSAGIMSRQSMGPVSPMPRNLSAFSSPNPNAAGDSGFLEPPPRYS